MKEDEGAPPAVAQLPAFTIDWRERQVDSRYGVTRTYLHVDHKGRVFAAAVFPDGRRESVILNGSYTGAEQAVAAICLYGQPFGFEAGDLELLRKFDRWGRERWGDEIASERARLAHLTARIAALLPPEEK